MSKRSSPGLREAKAQYKNILGIVARFEEPEILFDVYESARSTYVRSWWTEVGKELSADEYQIFLNTERLSVRIRGALDGSYDPITADLEYQDKFQPMQRYKDADERKLLLFARCFKFGIKPLKRRPRPPPRMRYYDGADVRA